MFLDKITCFVEWLSGAQRIVYGYLGVFWTTNKPIELSNLSLDTNGNAVQSVVGALFSLYITFDIYQGTSWTRQQLRRKLLTNQKLTHPSNIRQVVYLSLSPRRADTERGKGRMWLLHPRIPQSHQCLKLRINWIVYSMILLLLTTASNRHKLWVRSKYQHQSLCRTQVSEHT